MIIATKTVIIACVVLLLVSAGVKATVELDAAPGARYEATVRSVDLLPSASCLRTLLWPFAVAVKASDDVLTRLMDETVNAGRALNAVLP